jgi:hypothetical protein
MPSLADILVGAGQRRSENVEDWTKLPRWEYALRLLTAPYVQGAQSLRTPFQGPETMPPAASSQMARDLGINDLPPITQDWLWRSQQWGGK